MVEDVRDWAKVTGPRRNVKGELDALLAGFLLLKNCGQEAREKEDEGQEISQQEVQEEPVNKKVEQNILSSFPFCRNSLVRNGADVL